MYKKYLEFNIKISLYAHIMNLFFLFFTIVTTESLIFCSNCKFYRPWIEWPADKTMGKCIYFPIVYKESYNLISGELIEGSNDYEFCGKARIYENLCGKSGKCYVPKKNNTSLHT